VCAAMSHHTQSIFVDLSERRVQKVVRERAVHPFDRLGIHVLDRMIRDVSGFVSLSMAAHQGGSAVLAKIVCKIMVVFFEGG
jgi:hypothetical protein